MQSVFIYVAVFLALIYSLTAVRQTNGWRLLRDWAIANGLSLLLLPLLSVYPFTGNQSRLLLFCFAAYIVMMGGIFAIFLAVSRSAGHQQLRAFAGMYYRSPYLAAATTVLLLSLAGLPITAGFLGKWFVVAHLISSQKIGVVSVILISSVILLYSGFRVIQQMYARSGGVKEKRISGDDYGASASAAEKINNNQTEGIKSNYASSQNAEQYDETIKIRPAEKIIVCLAVAVTLLLGIFPNLLL